MNKLSRFIVRKFWYYNTIPCHQCGERLGEYTSGESYMDYILCEYEIRCSSCKCIKNYWAYGSHSDPSYYTQLLQMKLYRIKYKLRLVINQNGSVNWKKTLKKWLGKKEWWR